MNYLTITLTFMLFTFGAQAQLSEAQKLDLSKRAEFTRECEFNKNYLKPAYNMQCEYNYHHYNSSAYKKYSRTKALQKGSVKIAEFNALHPGMSKTLFKDYKKVAELINQFDVMGVTELIPLMADDLNNNLAVIDFVNLVPEQILEIKKEIRSLKKKQAAKYSIVRKRKLKLLDLQLKQLKNDLPRAMKAYRAPGYMKILDELQKLPGGEEWALIISPRGEAAPTSTTTELVGYYYRSSIVKPKVNRYCKGSRDFGGATPFACIVNMDAKDLGEDYTHVFSRRPFLAEFISGKFTFILVTSHVIFDSPNDNTDLRRSILNSAFNVDSYEDLGIGVQKGNWARFAEVKVTLDFINKLSRTEKYKDIIYMGDFNIEAENQYVSKLLKAWPGSKMFITDKTSATSLRYHSASGEETKGVSSNYDHFIFNTIKTKECLKKNKELNGGIFYFHQGKFGKKIDDIYKIRKQSMSAGEYDIDHKKYDRLYDSNVAPYATFEKEIYTIGKVVHYYERKYPLKSKGLIKDKLLMDEYAVYFEERVMDSQLYDSTYYYMYEQLISDHMPIYMECSNQ